MKYLIWQYDNTRDGHNQPYPFDHHDVQIKKAVNPDDAVQSVKEELYYTDNMAHVAVVSLTNPENIYKYIVACRVTYDITCGS